jgi:hypothetical protein
MSKHEIVCNFYQKSALTYIFSYTKWNLKKVNLKKW